MDIGSTINKVPSTGGAVVKKTTDAVQVDLGLSDKAKQALTLSAEQAGQGSKDVQREDIETAVASLQDYAQNSRRSLNFSVDEGGGRVVVKVTDADSGDVIRQLPSEEALRLAERLSETRSLLFEAKA